MQPIVNRLYRKSAIKDIPQFLARLATLLQEGYLFADCFVMLLPYHIKDYETWQLLVEEQFHKGGSAVDVFTLLGVQSHYLLAIELAELNGELAETLHAISTQMKFDQHVRERLRKAIAYPASLFIFLLMLVVLFRFYFLPHIQTMFTLHTTDAQTTAVQWSALFLHTPDYMLLLIASSVIAIVLLLVFMHKKAIPLQLQLWQRIPVIGTYRTLLLTRHFARSLSRLLETGFSMQQALYYLKKQTFHRQLSYVAAQIEERIVHGDTLAHAVTICAFFYPKFEQFVAHGEKSGLLARELTLYCELLDSKLTRAIERSLQLLQPVLFIVIAVCIVAAYASILLPIYEFLNVM